jgi:DNA-binding transcriptional regulator YiaG
MSESTLDDTFTIEELAEACRYSLVIAWSNEDGAYLATCPEIPRLIVHGETPEDAVKMGFEAIANWLSGLRSFGAPVPAPPMTARTTVIADAPVFDSDKVRAVRQGLHMSQPVFARLLNVSPETVKAWEQGKNTPSGAAARLLELAERHPKDFLHLISDTSAAD